MRAGAAVPKGSTVRGASTSGHSFFASANLCGRGWVNFWGENLRLFVHGQCVSGTVQA